MRSGPGTCHGSVGWLTASEATLIHLMEHGRGLGASLGLCVDCFFYQLIPTVEFSIALLHLGLDQGF